MGNWNVTIIGVGQHHNKGAENDADRIFKDCIELFLKAKQKILHASITFGGAEFGKDDAGAVLSKQRHTDYDTEIGQLLYFYNVETVDELVLSQKSHIERLEEKLRPNT
jgi:hypothetical protein